MEHDLCNDFAGVCLLVAILAELQEQNRRIAAIEHKDRARYVYHRKIAGDPLPRRPPGRPPGAKNKPRSASA
jgi:hypothetical protein